MKITKKLTAKEAIEYLKQGVTLLSYIDNKETYFSYKNYKIFIVNASSSFYLDTNEFLEIYFASIFYIYENDDEEIDTDRDSEYYSIKGINK